MIFMTMHIDLPEEIVNQILSYLGMTKERNGRYMNQLDKTDPRYAMLTRFSRNLYERNYCLSSSFFYLSRVQVNTDFSINLSIRTNPMENGVRYMYDFVAKCCGKNQCDKNHLCFSCKNVNYSFLNREYMYIRK